MTDTLGNTEPMISAKPEPEPVHQEAAEPDSPEVVEGTVMYCALPECPGTFTIDPDARGKPPKYCPDHRGNDPAHRRARRQWFKDRGITEGPDLGKHATGPGDEPPRIAFEVGSGGKPPKGGSATAAELAAVEARARQICQLVAALVMLGGNNDARRLADAKDIAAGTPAFATALRNLAQYEPAIRKIGAGGEVSDRAQAWMAMVMAAGVMVTPILVRHDVIKGGLAELASTILANGESLGTADTAA